ncbi:hypothetical protein BV210_07170 [Halorientalis sp. IM1011]|uniref:hypothetical protein n=1 Tax=Halorientalis sp. IM1011 TaxID=1932360 RepID=UPI00097CCEEF|nr:hypothetical protein [Halorientalis sp. IM1011]AQL42506.1 hypothetical protein BV210_07170 [Halorientalis sp. IM1011]
MDESPRRSVLRTGGTLLAGGLTVGLGGCLQTDGPGTPTDDDGDDSDDTDAGSIPGYADWLPAPAELGEDHYRFVVVDAASLAGQRDGLAGTRFEGVFDVAAQYGRISFADLSMAINVGHAQVLVGDVSDFRSSLSEQAEVTETYHGYTIYDHSAAVTDGTAVLPLNAEMGDMDGPKAAIDAKRGAIDRYTDASEDCRTLVAELGAAPLAIGRTKSGGSGSEGLVAAGANWSIDGDRATLAAPLVFESGDAVPVEAVRRAVADRGFYENARSTGVTATGRVATVEATFATADVTAVLPPSVSGDRQRDVPQVSFTWEYEARGDGVGVVTVSHHGGDAVEASELFVRGVGFVGADSIPDTDAGELDVVTADSQWPATNTATESGGNPAVAAGDRVRIGVASDFEIVLVWEPEDGDTSATLSEDTGPDA